MEEQRSDKQQQPDAQNSKEGKRENDIRSQDERYLKRAKSTMNIQTWISVILAVVAIGWGIVYAIVH